ncbi:MAG: hypothetical protein ACYC4Q_00120 [Victivallaceae bacterium]
MFDLLKKLKTALPGCQRGQIITEYAIMMAMFAMVAIALLVMTYYFSEYGWRVIKLVSIDYP